MTVTLTVAVTVTDRDHDRDPDWTRDRGRDQAPSPCAAALPQRPPGRPWLQACLSHTHTQTSTGTRAHPRAPSDAYVALRRRTTTVRKAGGGGGAPPPPPLVRETRNPMGSQAGQTDRLDAPEKSTTVNNSSLPFLGSVARNGMLISES